MVNPSSIPAFPLPFSSSPSFPSSPLPPLPPLPPLSIVSLLSILSLLSLISLLSLLSLLHLSRPLPPEWPSPSSPCHLPPNPSPNPSPPAHTPGIAKKLKFINSFSLPLPFAASHSPYTLTHSLTPDGDDSSIVGIQTPLYEPV